MDLLQLLSWACIVFTIWMFSTGLTDLKKMRESKSTENIQFLPFLTTCLNNLGWLSYGFLKKDQTIVLVNIIGALLQILYIVMYFHYTKDKRLPMLQTLAAGTVLACVWLYFTTFLTEGSARLSQLGLTCSVVTVSMYMSPLTDLGVWMLASKLCLCTKEADRTHVKMWITVLVALRGIQVKIVRSGNVQCLSFPLTVATFFTSTSWVLYGLQLNDYYVMVPNTPGILTSLVRFYLFWKFASVDQSLPSYKSLQI